MNSSSVSSVSAIDASPLASFLHHGLLPFVGRDAEFLQLVSFWSTVNDLSEPQALLLVGEAGVGKSRLIDELAARAIVEGGIIVHLKFVPGATLSLASLIAEALRSGRIARQLLKAEPGETFDVIAPALCRLARLRPTLFILEDVHLLQNESLAELRILLDAMASEFVKFLFVARPVSLPIKGVIEPILTARIELPPLDLPHIAELWRQLFERTPGDDDLQALHAATLGNPLAVRSALRGALQSQTIARSLGDEWRVTVPQRTFRQMLTRYVEVLSEGMAASLTVEESSAMRRLSLLGEVFAQEAATVLEPARPQIIESLISKGVLAPTELPPLPGYDAAGRAIRFAHTLLHRHCLTTAEVTPEPLVRLIGAGIPLYSMLPFELVSHHGAGTSTDPEILPAIEHSVHIISMLRDGPDWREAETAWHAAKRLFDAVAPRLTTDRRTLLEAELYHTILSLFLRDLDPTTAAPYVDRYLALTAQPDSDELALHRMKALGMRFAVETLVFKTFPEAIWNEFEELVRRHPLIAGTLAYVDILSLLLMRSNLIGDTSLIVRLEPRIMFMITSDSLPADFRSHALHLLGPSLIGHFSTPQQLESRFDMLRRFDTRLSNSKWLDITRAKIRLLETVGHLRELETEITANAPRARVLGLHTTLTGWLSRLILNKAAFGADLADVEKDLEQFIMGNQNRLRAWGREPYDERFCVVCMLRGDIARARAVIARMRVDLNTLPTDMSVILMADAGELDDLRDASISRLSYRDFTSLIDMAIRHDDMGTFHFHTEALLAAPIMTLRDILMTRAIVELAEFADQRLPGLLDSLRTTIGNAALDMLRWLDPRGLFAYMDAVLQRFEPFLLPADLKAWRRRIDLLAEDYRASVPTTSEHHIRLSMIGDISVHMPGAKPVPVRGARNRALLALMVANRMILRPLSYLEFCEFTSDVSGDPEYTQRFTRMAVSRLRSLLGRDAVLTGTDAPRLNPDLVRVDLLEAQHLIDLAVAAVESRNAFRAYDAIIAAVNLTRGEVPFPTQYESFFEAARDDFENRLRSALLSVARLLLSEGDHERAEAMLQRGFEAMPDDVELAELLGETLVRLNRRAEAEQLRMKLARMQSWTDSESPGAGRPVGN